MSAPSSSFVLLCAEEDDLELVRWVDVARSRGLSPEVVTGVERDDEPLVEALGDASRGLFVVLRSENLEGERLREIKQLFARHRKPHQRLTALRLERSADAAIAQIAIELRGPSRPRSETSMVMRLDEAIETGPHRVIVAAPMPPPTPTVEVALDLAQHVAQHEVTERMMPGDHTEPLAIGRPLPASPRRSSGAGLAATVVVALAIGGGALWLTLRPDAEAAATRSHGGRVSEVRAAESGDTPELGQPVVREAPVRIEAVPPGDDPTPGERPRSVPRSRRTAEPSSNPAAGPAEPVGATPTAEAAGAAAEPARARPDPEPASSQGPAAPRSKLPSAAPAAPEVVARSEPAAEIPSEPAPLE
ncbi:MAG: hypothetical protein IPK74_14700 [Deltaproteobacteria bacterium]|nr:hypothetical protein [Deltaproteobacteria bacterium]